MASAVELSSPPLRAGGARLRGIRAFLQRWSLPLAFLVVVAVFSAARPDAFLAWSNVRAILDEASVLVVVGSGITVVLLMGEFDLSIGSVLGASSAAAVVAMSSHGAPTLLAVLIGVGVGAGVGVGNGICVARLGIPSFIATLAVGSLALGLELALAETTIAQGLHSGYLGIATSEVVGLPLPVVIAACVAVLTAILLRLTVFGRYVTAVGDNPAAARLAGVPTVSVRLLGFTLAGALTGLGGVLLSARAASYYPNSGVGLLLPAYAAAFLGLSLGRGWRFNVLGTTLGVLLLGTVTTGLTMLNQPPWTTAVVNGAILLVAVVALSRQTREAL